MNEMNERQRALDFVALQMADQVPVNIGRQRRGFAPQLLWPILAEMPDAGIRQQGGHLGGNGLGDCDECNLIAAPTGARAGGADALLNVAQPLYHDR